MYMHLYLHNLLYINSYTFSYKLQIIEENKQEEDRGSSKKRDSASLRWGLTTHTLNHHYLLIPDLVFSFVIYWPWSFGMGSRKYNEEMGSVSKNCHLYFDMNKLSPDQLLPTSHEINNTELKLVHMRKKEIMSLGFTTSSLKDTLLLLLRFIF